MPFFHTPIHPFSLSLCANQNLKEMTDSIQFFLSQPLWFTVSFVTAYLGLLGYVAYILWDYRRRQYDE